MIGKGDINPWMPETDVVLHQALGKLAEEAAELAKIAVRCVIQGIDGQDPGNGKANREELMKEICDVQAVVSWLTELITLAPGVNARIGMKLDGFRRWQEMIEVAGK